MAWARLWPDLSGGTDGCGLGSGWTVVQPEHLEDRTVGWAEHLRGWLRVGLRAGLWASPSTWGAGLWPGLSSGTDGCGLG